ncbi:MAG: CBS domain-containing protein [Nocardioides sp.]
MLRWRLLGVSITADWTWLLIMGLLAWSLGGAAFPDRYPGLDPATYAVMGVAAAVLLFGSVLAHELCHTLVARRDGVVVKDIRLFLFGGASEAAGPLPGPGAELRMVAAGPLCTAGLAAAFLASAEATRVLGVSVSVVGVLGYIGELNLVLLAFNLLPALPLDGGRLLHSWLWHRCGSSAAATLRAGLASRAIAGGILVLGVLYVSGGIGMGVWLVIMGGYLLLIGQREQLAARAELSYGDLTVADVMTTSVVTVSPEMTVAELADLLRQAPSHPVYPVREQGRLVGVLVLRTAGRVPLERRAEVTIRDLMLTGEAAPSVRADLFVRAAVQVLASEPGRAAVVDDEDHLVGLISRTDLTRLVARTPVVGPAVGSV